MGFQSVFRFGRLSTSLALAAIATATFTTNAFAASAIEEVVVTAQRTEESIQDVPIAVSAFTGTMLEDKQIISPSDLQLNTPNVSFTATNFGGSSFSIRGIGRLVISASGDNGVSFHINEISMPTNLPAIEFFDMERVEVLRGPQGTLFGRNATGGVVNMITAKPDVDAVSGNIDAEYGSYNDQRLKGALNIPVTDTFAVRVAGLQLTRDGYIENTAHGQIGCARGTGPAYGTPCTPTTLQGIDDKIDGRDLWAYRITAQWNMTENSSGYLMYSKFNENDDKARITNQICQRNTIPVQGCTPNGFGFDTPHAGATTGGIFGGLNGAALLGTPAPPNAFPVTETGLRKMHTDFDPVYKYNEDMWEASYQYNFEKYTVIAQGGYFESEWKFQQDYNMDVGFNLEPTAANPTGYWPTSQPAGEQSADWTSSECNYNDGTSGIFGGCIYPADTTRVFAYDQSDGKAKYWTTELRLQSNYDGKLNFMVGSNYANSSGNGDYYVVANTLDLVGNYGVPLLGFPPLYPTMFDATGAPNGPDSYSWAYFGELYFQATDNIKITAGLRYNDDTKQTADSSVLFNSLNACAVGVAGLLPDCANGPVWQRSTLAGFYTLPQNVSPIPGTPMAPNPLASAAQLMALYGQLDPYNAYADAAYAALAANGGVPDAAFYGNYSLALQTLSGVPMAPGFSEQRKLTGSPTKIDWQETTGRIGIDWRVLDDSLIYAFYTRGYKPGGFNPPLNASFVASSGVGYSFEPEKVDAYEIGTKNSFMDGGLIVNASVFYYDYSDLQVSRIRENTSINGNMDATIYGFELETFYIPEFLPNLTLDVAYSYLNTSIDNSTATDPLDRTGGDPNFISLENIDPGSLTGVNYVARIAGGTGDPGDPANGIPGDLAITPALVQQAYAQCGALASAADGNANATCTTLLGATNPVVPVADGTVYSSGPAAGVPAYFSQAYLNAAGVATSSGFDTDLDGNSLPNSPENTIHIGAAYAIATSWGTFTPRVDYYWQDDSYGREFNTVGDQIDSWDQWNASILYQTDDGRWEARGWIRNIGDEDNITGHYLTSDTSGFYRNYFLTEPRIYGMSVKFNFGALN